MPVGNSDLIVALDPNASVDAVSLHLVAKRVLHDRRVEVTFFQTQSSVALVFLHLDIIKKEIQVPVITFLARRNDRAVLNIFRAAQVIR